MINTEICEKGVTNNKRRELFKRGFVSAKEISNFKKLNLFPNDFSAYRLRKHFEKSDNKNILRIWNPSTGSNSYYFMFKHLEQIVSRHLSKERKRSREYERYFTKRINRLSSFISNNFGDGDYEGDI